MQQYFCLDGGIEMQPHASEWQHIASVSVGNLEFAEHWAYVRAVYNWLITHVGQPGVAWKWVSYVDMPLIVNFKDSRYMTLFLLRWGSN